MLRILAILFGLILIASGILGFLPDFVQDGKLFGVFSTNFWHSAFDLIVGVIALICGFSGSLASKIYFILVGLVFLAAAILVFIQGEGTLFGRIAVNQADNWVLLAVSIITLYFGLFIKSK